LDNLSRFEFSGIKNCIVETAERSFCWDVYSVNRPQWIVYYTVSQKNAPTLASCSFDKHGLILIIFGKQHQHTFRNDMHVHLSLSLHFYLLYLLLNSCHGNDAFWRHSMLVKQSSSFSRKHRTLSVQICVCQTVQLTNRFVDWCRMCVFIVQPPVHDINRCDQRLNEQRLIIIIIIKRLLKCRK